MPWAAESRLGKATAGLHAGQGARPGDVAPGPNQALQGLAVIASMLRCHVRAEGARRTEETVPLRRVIPTPSASTPVVGTAT